jgi:hypothetical protein
MAFVLSAGLRKANSFSEHLAVSGDVRGVCGHERPAGCEQLLRKTARNKGFQATKNRPDGGFDSFIKGKLVAGARFELTTFRL